MNISAIRKELGQGGISPRIAGMWRYMLDCHEKVEQGAKWEEFQSENCDAIPYLPEECVRFLPKSAGVVLDIGCFGGYGLCDLSEALERSGKGRWRLVGIDFTEESVAFASQMRTTWDLADRCVFVRGTAEDLSIGSEVCDVVIARLLLPYVRMEKVLIEVVRVLKEGGVILLQVHAPRYYVRRMRACWRNARLLVYYVRPLMARLYMRWSGRQARGMFWGETALTRGDLVKLCSRHGLHLELEGGGESKPWGVFRKGKQLLVDRC